MVGIKTNYLVTIFLFFMVIISTSYVFALDFEVDYKPITDTIYPDELAEYEISIFNLGNYNDAYTFYSIDPSFLTKFEPTVLEVSAYSNKTFKLQIQPRSDTRTGPYLVPLRALSRANERFVDTTLFLYLKTYNPISGVYEPAISLDLRMNDVIDPREKLALTLILKNRNALDVKDLQITIESPLFNNIYTTSIAPLKDKTEELLFDIDPLAEPGLYKVRIYLDYKNKTIAEILKNYQVIDYSAIRTEKTKERELFKTTTVLNFENTGNYQKKQNITEPYSLFTKIFTSTDPKAAVVKLEGKRFYQWEITLSPKEKKQVFVIENYRSLATAILLLILIIIGYYILRSPVVSIKQAKIHGSITEITDIKIRIILKNRSRKPVYNVKVIDRIPRIANINDDDSISGSLKPNKIIRQENQSTLLRWDLEKLEPYEERIIVYKMKSHLKIVGGIELPSVKVKFDTGLGKERTILSNEVSISTTKLDEPVEK